MQRSKSFVQNLQMMSRPSITPSLWQISNSMAGLDVLHHPHCRSELMPSSRSCAWQEIKLQPQHFRWQTKTQGTRSKSSRIQQGCLVRTTAVMSCAHHRRLQKGIVAIASCKIQHRYIQHHNQFLSATAMHGTRHVCLSSCIRLTIGYSLCILLFIGAVGKSAQLGLFTRLLPGAMEGP